VGFQKKISSLTAGPTTQPLVQYSDPGYPLEFRMRQTLVQTAINKNSWASDHQLQDGGSTPFMIVPFNDGSMPTQAPVSSPALGSWNSMPISHAQHHLPPLTDVTAIRALTAAHSSAYAAGYDLGDIESVPARRAAIGRAIGCTLKINI